MKYSSLSALPRHIASGVWKSGHVQGIAVDLENGFLYYSFTTMIVKTDLEGNLIGWADGIVGHLGCMDFCQADGRVYASLEYKDDCIGTSILEMVGSTQEPQIGFYIAIFDGARITRPGMNATRDGIMTTLTRSVENNGYVYYDWDVDSGDASDNLVDADIIYNNVKQGVFNRRDPIILMHDSKIKTTTVDALPRIIEYLQGRGYDLVPITPDTPPAHQRVFN